MKSILIAIIKIYRRLISPFLPLSCRFVPSCSEFALEAVRVHGAFKGSCLTIARLLRCHPLCPGGWDPVPGPRHRKV